MYQIVEKPRAILMAKEAYEWYEKQKQGLGDEFLKELDKFYHYKPTKKSKKKCLKKVGSRNYLPML